MDQGLGDTKHIYIYRKKEKENLQHPKTYQLRNIKATTQEDLTYKCRIQSYIM